MKIMIQDRDEDGDQDGDEDGPEESNQDDDQEKLLAKNVSLLASGIRMKRMGIRKVIILEKVGGIKMQIMLIIISIITIVIMMILLIMIVMMILTSNHQVVVGHFAQVWRLSGFISQWPQLLI